MTEDNIRKIENSVHPLVMHTHVEGKTLTATFERVITRSTGTVVQPLFRLHEAVDALVPPGPNRSGTIHRFMQRTSKLEQDVNRELRKIIHVFTWCDQTVVYLVAYGSMETLIANIFRANPEGHLTAFRRLAGFCAPYPDFAAPHVAQITSNTTFVPRHKKEESFIIAPAAALAEPDDSSTVQIGAESPRAHSAVAGAADTTCASPPRPTNRAVKEEIKGDAKTLPQPLAGAGKQIPESIMGKLNGSVPDLGNQCRTRLDHEEMEVKKGQHPSSRPAVAHPSSLACPPDIDPQDWNAVTGPDEAWDKFCKNASLIPDTDTSKFVSKVSMVAHAIGEDVRAFMEKTGPLSEEKRQYISQLCEERRQLDAECKPLMVIHPARGNLEGGSYATVTGGHDFLTDDEEKRQLEKERDAANQELEAAKEELERLRCKVGQLSARVEQLESVPEEGAGRVDEELERRTAEEAVGETNSSFVCPVSIDLMKDPVVASDGFTYERVVIEDWIERERAQGRNPRSPWTNEPLQHTSLTPNHTLKRAICEAVEEEARRRKRARHGGGAADVGEEPAGTCRGKLYGAEHEKCCTIASTGDPGNSISYAEKGPSIQTQACGGHRCNIARMNGDGCKCSCGSSFGCDADKFREFKERQRESSRRWRLVNKARSLAVAQTFAVHGGSFAHASWNASPYPTLAPMFVHIGGQPPTGWHQLQ